MEHGEIVGGRYRVIELLGQGGMGSVWRAQDISLGHWVAIKVIRRKRDEMRGNDTDVRFQEWRALRARFRREARLLQTLRHPGIPELYDEDSHRGDPYIVMRLVEGVPLNKFYKTRRPFHVPVAIAIAYQIADALACAHALPVAHRDLKPKNLVLGEDGRMALLDFGIARPLQDGATQITEHARSIGTVGYMSPEQIRGEPVNVLTDMYAFGCVCYELLAGRPPFLAGDDDGRIREQHLYEEPPPIGDFTSRVPEALDDFVLQLLSKNPMDRPDTAVALRMLTHYLPKLGSPAPELRLDPDPTRPFREGQSEKRDEPVRPRRRPGRRASFLSERKCRETFDQVREELDAGEPGEALDRLLDLLPRMRREWGFTKPFYRDARLLCADGLCAAGNYGRAREIYTEMLQDHRADPSDEGRGSYLVARIGIAQCLCPFGGNAEALDELRAVVAEVPELTVPWARPVVACCRELAIKLAELGYQDEVDDILRGLPDEDDPDENA